MAEPLEIVLSSIFTGIGIAIGTPIGLAIYERYLKDWIKRLHNGEDKHSHDPN